MYYERFDVHTGKVIYVDQDGVFAILIVQTPDGTDNWPEQAFTAKLEDGMVACTALDIEHAEIDERVHFSGLRTDRKLKKGDELMYRTTVSRSWSGTPIPELTAWCYADELHRKRSLMNELRCRAADGKTLRFHHILDLMQCLKTGKTEIPDNATWQERPGNGTDRGYGGCIGEEVEMGWQDCPDPRLALIH